jgi:hypothetical protein
LAGQLKEARTLAAQIKRAPDAPPSNGTGPAGTGFSVDSAANIPPVVVEILRQHPELLPQMMQLNPDDRQAKLRIEVDR